MQRDPRTGWERWLKPCTQRLKAGGFPRVETEKACLREEAEGSPPKMLQGLRHLSTSCPAKELLLLLLQTPWPSSRPTPPLWSEKV